MGWIDLISAAVVLLLACIIIAALNTHRRPSRSSYQMHEGEPAGVSSLFAKVAAAMIAVVVLVGFLVVWAVTAQFLTGLLAHYLGQSEYVAPLAWMLGAAIGTALAIAVVILIARLARSLRQ